MAGEIVPGVATLSPFSPQLPHSSKLASLPLLERSGTLLGLAVLSSEEPFPPSHTVLRPLLKRHFSRRPSGLIYSLTLNTTTHPPALFSIRTPITISPYVDMTHILHIYGYLSGTKIHGGWGLCFIQCYSSSSSSSSSTGTSILLSRWQKFMTVFKGTLQIGIINYF